MISRRASIHGQGAPPSFLAITPSLVGTLPVSPLTYGSEEDREIYMFRFITRLSILFGEYYVVNVT